MELIDLLKNRLKPIGNAGKYGRLYVSKDLIGMKASYVTEWELSELVKEIKRLDMIRQFSTFVLNTKNGTRMFNIISKTWNPVSGCTHYCVYCWARRLALTKLKNTPRYRDGFWPKLNVKEFKVKFNGGVVFVSDMGDLFSPEVPDEWITKVIDHVSKFPNTLFLFLTKNPGRYSDFIDVFPENSILGATIETDNDGLYYERKISQAPLPSLRYKAMKNIDWDKKFISIEPILDFNLERFVSWIKEINPFMVYVGYDNYNNKLPEPSLEKTEKLIEELSKFTLVVKKTIRRAWHEKGSLLKHSIKLQR